MPTTEASSASDLTATQVLELRRRLAVAEEIGDLLAHELRDLVVVLQAHSNLLARQWQRLDEQQQRHSIDTIDRETARLGELLIGLLDIRRPMQDRDQEVYVAGLIQEAVAATSPGGLPAGAIVIDCAENMWVRTNRDLLQLVVHNLVENALFHGKAPVRLHATRTDDRLRVRVDDAGPGVDPAHLPFLFHQAARRDPTKPGLGLGLALVHDLVRLHGGSITYEQLEPTGASFTLELPVG